MRMAVAREGKADPHRHAGAPAVVCIGNLRLHPQAAAGLVQAAVQRGDPALDLLIRLRQRHPHRIPDRQPRRNPPGTKEIDGQEGGDPRSGRSRSQA